MQDAVEISRPLIEASGHELTVALPPRPVYVEGDRTRLAQAFANLLNNAAKFHLVKPVDPAVLEKLLAGLLLAPA